MSVVYVSRKLKLMDLSGKLAREGNLSCKGAETREQFVHKCSSQMRDDSSFESGSPRGFGAVGDGSGRTCGGGGALGGSVPTRPAGGGRTKSFSANSVNILTATGNFIRHSTGQIGNALKTINPINLALVEHLARFFPPTEAPGSWVNVRPFQKMSKSKVTSHMLSQKKLAFEIGPITVPSNFLFGLFSFVSFPGHEKKLF